MTSYDKYGRMTVEFRDYQFAAWDAIRKMAEQITRQAIADGVCPIAMQKTMQTAVECGVAVEANRLFVRDAVRGGSDDVHMGMVKGL